MCNPQLIMMGASAVMQYRVANAQQKALKRQQERQNEIAMRNRNLGVVTKTRKYIQLTKAKLAKIGEAEKISRRKRAKFKVRKEGFKGNTYDFLLANYYDHEANYRNRILGNIESSKFQYIQDMKYVDLRYDSQSTYVSPVNRKLNAFNSGIGFASNYYDYKSKQNRYQTNNERYGYGDFDDDDYYETGEHY